MDGAVPPSRALGAPPGPSKEPSSATSHWAGKDTASAGGDREVGRVWDAVPSAGDLWQQEQHLSLSVRALQSRFPAAAAHGACEQRRGKQSRREGSDQGKEPGLQLHPGLPQA